MNRPGSLGKFEKSKEIKKISELASMNDPQSTIEKFKQFLSNAETTSMQKRQWVYNLESSRLGAQIIDSDDNIKAMTNNLEPPEGIGVVSYRF